MKAGCSAGREARIAVRRLGRVDYESGLALQKTLVEQRKDGAIPDQLLLLEHPDVITLGVKARNDRSHVLETPEPSNRDPRLATRATSSFHRTARAVPSST